MEATRRSIPHLILAFIVIMGTVFGSTAAWAEEAGDTYNWIQGGTSVDLGSNLAALNLDKDMVFLGAEDTQKMQQKYNGYATNREIGSVFPMDDTAGWAVIFEYDEPGHIVDDEKEDIDADGILDSYKEGTEENNKTLEDSKKLYVDGWETAPFYDEKSHHLSWSLLGHDSNNEKFINYNVRLLSKEGYVSAILISDPANLAHDKKELEDKILPNFSFKPGAKYEDYDASVDKTAEYGLSGLILGAAGIAVAKKVGLLAMGLIFFKKAWFLVIAIPVAIWNFIRRRSAKKAEEAPVTDTPQA